MNSSERPEFLQPKFKHQLVKSPPPSLNKKPLTDDERVFLEKQALDIFTICSNSGLPLRDSLAAILLTGIDWGINLSE